MPVPPEPYINIQSGAVGTLVHGQSFYWYNPTSSNVLVKNCGTWCTADSYQVPANGSVQATIQNVPNNNAFAFTESPNEWNAPGMPHIQAPTMPMAEKDVA